MSYFVRFSNGYGMTLWILPLPNGEYDFVERQEETFPINADDIPEVVKFVLGRELVTRIEIL